ncbi:MAG: YidC/Oxa1 family membrane protein insertase [Eubacterium sp.]|nr:YidC/Oxa1 family membrane protein insertase [Eubacterium sp.]
MILTQSSSFLLGGLSKLLGWIMNGIYNLFNNMGVLTIALSIIVFTVIVRLLMFPLSIKSTRSSKIQAYLQPEFQKINKKYRGKKDQASILAKQKETSALQKKYGIKMSTGCITALIQLPIFLSLYNVIQNIPAYVDRIKALYQPIADAIMKVSGAKETLTTFVTENAIQRAPDLSKVSELTSNYVIDVLAKCNGDALDKIGTVFSSNSEVASSIAANKDKIIASNDFILGINLSEVPGWAWTWALIIPIAAFAFQLLSMIVTPQQSSGDPQQDAQMKSMRRFMMVMPIMSFFVTISVPAGLGLYWAVSAMVSVIITLSQNFYYKHADMQAITEKARLKAEAKAERKKARNGGVEKKGFLDRMQEAATGQNTAEQKSQDSEGMRNFGSARLKSYTSSTSYKNDVEEKKNVKYKEGSIASKANALRDYYEKNNKD